MATDINDKLLKVIALAKQGIGGEKTAAIATVKRICKTHGLDYDEVMGAAETAQIKEFVLDIKWRNKMEEDMLAQVCLKFACTPDNPDLFYNQYRKVYIYNTTAAKHLETINAASVYLHQFRKERKKLEQALLGAFCQKHRLYPTEETYNARHPEQAKQIGDGDSKIDVDAEFKKIEEARRRMALAEGMDDVNLHKSIGSGA